MLSLKAVLGLDGSGFEVGLKRAQSSAEKFSHNLSHGLTHHLGAFLGFAAMEQAVHKTIEYGEKIFDLSKRLGVSTDALQQWDYALRQNGASAEDAANFFEKLGQSRDKALGGNREAIDSFKKLGVTIDDLQSKRLEDIALKIGETVKGGDIQKFIGALKEIGGKGAGALAAAFRDGLDEKFKEAVDKGLVIPPERIAELKAIGDSFTDIGKKIIAGLAPAVTVIAKFIKDFYETVEVGLGSISAFVGNFSVTHSFSSAYKELLDTRDKFVNESHDREEAEKKRAEDLKHGSGEGGASVEESKKAGVKTDTIKEKAEKASSASLNVNSLQAIGALVRADNSNEVQMRYLTAVMQKNVMAANALVDQLRYLRTAGSPAISTSDSATADRMTLY